MCKEDVIGKLEDACNRLVACVKRCEAGATAWRTQLMSALREKLAAAESGVDAELESLKERELADYARQVEHVSKLLSGPAPYADVGSFAQGLEDETVAWFRRYHAEHHRQRKVLACVNGALTSFCGSLDERLDAFVSELRDEAMRACDAEIAPLLADVQTRLDEIGTVQVDEREDGTLKSVPIVPDNEDLLNVGNFELSAKLSRVEQLPIILEADRLNIISYSYPPGARSSLGRDNCRVLLSNVLEQVLQYGLPETEVHILDGDALVSGFDGCLRNLTRRLGEKEISVVVYEKLAKADELRGCLEKLAAQFTDQLPSRAESGHRRSAHVFLLIPETSNKDEVLRFQHVVEDAMARWHHWLRFLIVGQKKTLDQLDKWDERFCASRRLDLTEDGGIALEVGANRMEGTARLSDWQTDPERGERTYRVIEGLANPPRRISDQSVVFKTAHEPSKTAPFGLVFDATNMGTTFIEGHTGSGKSVLLTQMLMAAIEDYTPQQLQLYLLDLKGGSTASKFDKFPHVKYILAVNGKNNVDVVRSFLELLRGENFARLEACVNEDVQTLEDYNLKMVKAGRHDKVMPRVVVVVDECESLFSSNQKEGHLSMSAILNDLLSQCRSQGMHFIFTSQKRGDLPSEYYGHFQHYILLRKLDNSDVYEARHYGRPAEANNDRDEYRRGLLLQLYPYDKDACDRKLSQLMKSFSHMPARTIYLKAKEYQSIEGFPLFDEALSKACDICASSSREKGLVAALGVSLGHVDSLQIVEFSPSQDKPHLLITGRPDCPVSSSDLDTDMKGVVPRDACLGLMIETLAESSTRVRVTVIDPNRRLSTKVLPSLGRKGVRHVCGHDDCRAALQSWMRQGLGKEPEADPTVLFVNDAQKLPELFDRPEESAVRDVGTITDPHWNGGHIPKWKRTPEGVTGISEPPKADKGADFGQCLRLAHRHHAYLVLVTNEPGRLEPILKRLLGDSSFSFGSRFRVVHFNFTGERLTSLRQEFDNRSPINGNVLETSEFENRLSSRFLPFMPFTRETVEKESK